jgi:hypothetical protein
MDYLQLMPICNSDIGQGNPRYLEIRHIMDMGIIATEKTQSVIIAAAQLGREERRSGSKTDDTQGWRESGDIEQTAWNLIKLTREKENLSFKITKARNSEGVDTAYGLDWIPAYQYMANNGKPANKKNHDNAEPGTLVLMDYLQLMPICNTDIGQRNPRYLEIQHIMNMGKMAAEKTQSVIIAAAQLGREDRNNRSKDDTQGWRESGDIEQTAWNLIKMTRGSGGLSFRITKARGSAGVDTAYRLDWIPAYQYMANGGKLQAPERTKREKADTDKPITKIGGLIIQ